MGSLVDYIYVLLSLVKVSFQSLRFKGEKGDGVNKVS